MSHWGAECDENSVTSKSDLQPGPSTRLQFSSAGKQQASRVAAVLPTPQLETGTLSPAVRPGRSRSPATTTTPRMPLAELSPAHLPGRLVLTSPAPGQPSPTLLHTQLAAPTARQERRHQLTTELQLMELRQEVENMKDHIGRGCQAGAIDPQLEELLQERRALQEELDMKDRQMEAFKKSLATLNAEYMTDLRSVKADCTDLTERLLDREEELAKLKEQHQKSLKTIAGFQAYIPTLPAKEEMIKLKAKYQTKTEDLTLKVAETAALTEEVNGLRENLNFEKKAKLELEVENNKLVERNTELKASLEEHETRRLEARSLGENQVELIMFDKLDLEREKDKLTRQLSWTKTKFQQEKAKLEEQVRRLGGLLEQTNRKLQESSTSLREANTNNAMLEAEMKKLGEERTTLQWQLERVGGENSELRCETESGARLGGHHSRLARSMARCITELTLLCELCSQVMSGGDPNMSVLLGVREVTSPIAASPLLADPASLPSAAQQLELARQQLQEVARVEGEVKQLRQQISDKYAENLADNMTSCVTQ